MARPRLEKKSPPATQPPDLRGRRATFYTTGTSTRARQWPCLAVEQSLREGRAILS